MKLKDRIMRKEVQEALESAIAGFEKRQQAEQERLRERERFETDWARIRTAVVLPALEEVMAVLRKAGWQCEVRAGDKDPGVHFTIYRGVKAGMSGGERPFMTYQPEKLQTTVLINVATKGSAASVGSFALDKITEDFVQTEATKFFARVASEIG
jgi:signal recognition particle subunit SEC65